MSRKGQKNMCANKEITNYGKEVYSQWEREEKLSSKKKAKKVNIFSDVWMGKAERQKYRIGEFASTPLNETEAGS